MLRHQSDVTSWLEDVWHDERLAEPKPPDDVEESVPLHWRVSTPAHRQQTKWVVFGIITATVGYLAGWLFIHLLRAPKLRSPQELLADLVGSTLIYASLLLIPLCVGVAMLRHHLFDIDVIIRRTLVYGTLTSTLALIYASSILVAQVILQAITGSKPLPSLSLVASTLLIAVLFRPLRTRLQTAIDRRYNRRRYDSVKTLAAFSAQLRTQTN